MAAFQQLATDDGDEMILESSVPAIAEEDEEDGAAGAAGAGASLNDDANVATSHVSDAHLLQTMAEVLPIRETSLETFKDDDDDALL